MNELAILFGTGMLAAILRCPPVVPGALSALSLWSRVDSPRGSSLAGATERLPEATGAIAAGGAVTGAAAAAPFSLWALFGVFAKIGAVLFGSGYVLLAFLRADLVERLHWLTERQLLDAVAVGQVTPGPVFTTASFVGYVLAGAPGAVAATVGIFLPAFAFVAISGPLVPHLRRSPTAAAVLDGVNVASLALMTIVTVELGHAALVDPLTVVLAVASAVLLLWRRVNSAWLVLAGALAGVLLR